MKNESKLDNKIDYGILFSVFLLVIIGMAALYVSLMHDPLNVSLIKPMVSQGVWYVFGAACMVAVMQLDSEQLWRLTPYFYAAGIFLLILVLVFFDRQIAFDNGAKSWFRIGSFTFQPSEVAKPAYIVMLARITTLHNTRYPTHSIHSDFVLIFELIGWTLPIIGLIMLQPDLGTTLVFVAIFLGILIMSGIMWQILVPSFLAVGGLIGGVLALVVFDQGFLIKLGFKPYQFDRIFDWLNPTSGSVSSNQVLSSIQAIGSGQLWGKGFGVSQVYVPVRESDMIFSVIGENFGFIGSCVLIFIYFVLIYQMLSTTFETKNEFYAYISTGVIMMILFHVFENIGMSIGLLPMTGVPLPFISQGGSNLLSNMIGVGLVMSMKFHYKNYMFSRNSETFSSTEGEVYIK
ncbi:FtsW/RodA/SpoVE family cell cycle protein [Xylocopilactobacillus apis]|uniref:Cell division protein FtsW n=1 Tax=Xylocopilactobacillus apis TaxID=2932183 RepID=A0AAU9D943_9LACO|nr:FtsW/RodA/SpoVE family cell cycle protein [Xylocopilactobacillus apis]BDR56190.1 cell division protein FtsW [Xylocopilactobacillus apis]